MWKSGALVFCRISKRGGKRGKLAFVFGVFHAFLGASFPQRRAWRFSTANPAAYRLRACPGSWAAWLVAAWTRSAVLGRCSGASRQGRELTGASTLRRKIPSSLAWTVAASAHGG